MWLKTAMYVAHNMVSLFKTCLFFLNLKVFNIVCVCVRARVRMCHMCTGAHRGQKKGSGVTGSSKHSCSSEEESVLAFGCYMISLTCNPRFLHTNFVGSAVW